MTLFRADDRLEFDKRFLQIHDPKDFALFQERAQLGFNALVYDYPATPELIAAVDEFLAQRRKTIPHDFWIRRPEKPYRTHTFENKDGETVTYDTGNYHPNLNYEDPQRSESLGGFLSLIFLDKVQEGLKSDKKLDKARQKAGIPPALKETLALVKKWGDSAKLLQDNRSSYLYINSAVADEPHKHRPTLIFPARGDGVVCVNPQGERHTFKTFQAVLFDEEVEHLSPTYTAERFDTDPRLFIVQY
jgi:hypothetical protein